MAIDYDLLATIHGLLKQKAALEDRIAKGPRMVRVAQNNEQTFSDSVDAAKQKVTETKMAADEKQLQLSEREAKIETTKGRLNTCDSNKEYQLLKDSIAADQQANSVLSDEILEMLERIDVLETELESARDDLEKAQSKTREVTERVNSEAAQLQSDLNEVVSELTRQEKGLPGDVKIEYKRLVEGLGEDALAKSDGRVCGNCQHTFTAQTYNELCAKKPVFCKGCGSLMYTRLGVQSA